MMDIRTLTALRGSITKWERIAAGTEIDKGSANCPLCQEFFHEYRRQLGKEDMERGCSGCPVAEAGHTGCEGTPYYQYKGVGDKEAAIAEVEFLKSLLPEGDR